MLYTLRSGAGDDVEVVEAREGEDMSYNWKSAEEAGYRLSALSTKSGRYSDEELVELRALLARGVFTIAANVPTMQFRAAIELVEAKREMNRASGQLVETTNSLTRRGLWLSGSALAIAVASLAVSVFALAKQ